jgi:hypothetical protein
LITQIVLAQNVSCAAALAYPSAMMPMSKILPSDGRFT